MQVQEPQSSLLASLLHARFVQDIADSETPLRCGGGRASFHSTPTQTGTIIRPTSTAAESSVRINCQIGASYRSKDYVRTCTVPKRSIGNTVTSKNLSFSRQDLVRFRKAFLPSVRPSSSRPFRPVRTYVRTYTTRINNHWDSPQMTERFSDRRKYK